MPWKLKLFGSGTKTDKKKNSDSMSQSADVIQKLRETEGLFIKMQQHLEEQIEEQFIIVRANLTRNKPVAKRALVKKKRLEKQLADATAQMGNLEIQREALEAARLNTEVFKTMTGAAGALKTAHKTLDVDKVHDVMDEIAEQQDIGQEIFDAMSKPVLGYSQVDDADVDKELDALTQEELDNTLLAVGKDLPIVSIADDASDEDKKAQGPSSFKPKGSKPSAPSSRNKTTGLTKQEEAELQELEKWVAD